MKALQLIVLIALLLQQEWPAFANNLPYSAGQINENQARDVPDISASSVLGSIYRKSRQSRCVRCYEDRYGDDRSRSYGSGYSSSRSSDDDRNWYRYDDHSRSSTDRDYDRYYSSYYRDRDDRYSPRTYDRYDGRGYEGRDYATRGYESRSYDPYNDRKGSYYDYYRDRSYDRPRQGYGYDRDYYDRDRYSSRGQSGFDKSGRGYYFAGANNGPRHSNDDRSQPCGTQVTNCPNRDTGATIVTSRPIDSSGQNGQNGSGSLAINSSANNKANGANKNGWTYVNEQDKSTRGNGEREREREGDRDRDRDSGRDRDQQSSSYGGRPPRPLGGSYLLDRDSNLISDGQTNANTAAMSDEAATKDMPGAATAQERAEAAAGGKQ